MLRGQLQSDGRSRLLTGPSHSARLRNAIRTGQLPDFGHEVVGVGGMPIWSPRLGHYRDGFEDIVHMVGDFRFGNLILEEVTEPDEIAASLQEVTGVSKALIGPKQDMLLYQAAMTRIRALVAEGRAERFMFWDLTIREFEARQAGRYMHKGWYHHPTWNLEEVLNQLKGSCIDTRDLLEGAAPFYLDSSAHPSFLGWWYILSRAMGISVSPATLRTRFAELLEEVFFDLRQRCSAEKVILCGSSRFTRILKDYVERGSFFLPDWISVQPTFTELEDSPELHYVFFPACFEETNAVEEAARLRRTVGYGLVAGLRRARLSWVFFDHWAEERVAHRRPGERRLGMGPDPISVRAMEELFSPTPEGTRMSEVNAWGGMLELGLTLHPTVLGLIKVIARVAYPSTEAEAEARFALVRDGMAKLVLSGR